MRLSIYFRSVLLWKGLFPWKGVYFQFWMVKKRNRVIVREEFFLYAHELFDEMPKRSVRMSYEP